jgi:hypothetical protein
VTKLHLALIAIGLCVFASCSSPPLPEAESDAARLYVQRCAVCHTAYNPHSLTMAMWRYQMDAMKPKIQQAGMPPLTDDDSKIILDYLSRNAAK